MAQSSWPFENIDTSETQFSLWARNIGEGVIAGKGLELETFADSTGMLVKVKSGQALVRGHYYSSSAEETLTVPTANPTNPRIDLIVARLDPTANSIVLALVTGTPASSPTAPTPTQTDADVYEIPLAEVYVGAGVVTIIAGNVTDLRSIFEPNAGGVAAVFSDTAPEDTDAIWYNTENGNAYLYYDGFWTSISGISIPAGGTTGQVLAKSSNTDYATEWVAPSLTLISKTDFSAVSSLSLNDIFSGTYENYKVFITTSSSSADNQLLLRLRVSGADNTNNSYIYGGYGVGAFGGEGAAFVGSTTSTSFWYGFSNNTYGSAWECNVYSPFVSKSTKITSVGAGHRQQVMGGGFGATTSFTGLTFLTNTGTITGSVWVYGLRNS